jgi:predicted glutamine amidotransferase
MCRWLAYSGSPVLLEDLLLKPTHSLIIQSLHSRLGATTTNGDGFGVGWYGEGDAPGVFHSIAPAWNDRNLKELSRHVVSSWCSPMSVPRPGVRSNRPIVTPSVTGRGFGCTTA